MHSNTTDQNTDNNTTLIINNHDVESDDSLLHGEGSVVQKRAKNDGDINKRERRSLEKMSIWTVLNRLMVRAIEEKISKKLEGTGVTIDDLFYTSVDKLNGKHIDLQDLIQVPYSEIYETMIKNVATDINIPPGMKTTMPESVDEYIDLIKNHYGLTIFNLIDKETYNDKFLLPFLPWLKELSFSNNDKNPIVDDNLTLEKLEVAGVHSPLRRLCELYPSEVYNIQQKLIRIKFNIACLKNDWEKASHYLNELPNTRNIMLEDLSPLIFYYDNDVDQKIIFLNSLWSKITSNMYESAKARTLSLWLQSCIEKSNLLVADWIWSKTENIEAKRVLLMKEGRSVAGVADRSMIYEIILKKNDVSALEWVWKRGEELNIQRAMLLELGNENIGFYILGDAIKQNKKDMVVFLYSKAGELNGEVQREVLPQIGIAIAHGYDKIVDLLWEEAEKLGGRDLQHEILKARNYKLLGMIIKSIKPSNEKVVASFLNKALPLFDVESVAKNAIFRANTTDQHLDNCLKLLEKSTNHEAIDWMQHFISKRKELMQSRTKEVPPASRKKTNAVYQGRSEKRYGGSVC